MPFQRNEHRPYLSVWDVLIVDMLRKRETTRLKELVAISKCGMFLSSPDGARAHRADMYMISSTSLRQCILLTNALDLLFVPRNVESTPLVLYMRLRARLRAGLSCMAIDYIPNSIIYAFAAKDIILRIKLWIFIASDNAQDELFGFYVMC